MLHNQEPLLQKSTVSCSSVRNKDACWRSNSRFIFIRSQQKTRELRLAAILSDFFIPCYIARDCRLKHARKPIIFSLAVSVTLAVKASSNFASMFSNFEPEAGCPNSFLLFFIPSRQVLGYHLKHGSKSHLLISFPRTLSKLSPGSSADCKAS